MYLPYKVKVDAGKGSEMSKAFTERAQPCISDIGAPTIKNKKMYLIRYIYSEQILEMVRLILVRERRCFIQSPIAVSPVSVREVQL